MKIVAKISTDGNICTNKIFKQFWGILEIPLINYQVNLILAWSSTGVITNSTSAGRFTITYKKLCSSSEFIKLDNSKLLQHLKSDFKRAINWIKLLAPSF